MNMRGTQVDVALGKVRLGNVRVTVHCQRRTGEAVALDRLRHLLKTGGRRDDHIDVVRQDLTADFAARISATVHVEIGFAAQDSRNQVILEYRAFRKLPTIVVAGVALEPGGNRAVHSGKPPVKMGLRHLDTFGFKGHSRLPRLRQNHEIGPAGCNRGDLRRLFAGRQINPEFLDLGNTGRRLLQNGRQIFDGQIIGQLDAAAADRLVKVFDGTAHRRYRRLRE